jgi:hypothetical protein
MTQTICRRRVCIPDGSVWGTSRSGEDMAYVQRRTPRRPTFLATLETRGAKGMHTRPCGFHIIPGYRSVLNWASTEPEATGENAGRCGVGSLFPRSFAGRSIQPEQSLGRASSCRKAQGGHNHLRTPPGDASGGETTMKGNT